MTYGGTELISNGTLPSYFNALPTPTQDVIQRLSDTSKSTSPDNDYLTYESFATAFRKWRESTSTSPSGRHLGHYKSLLSIDSNASKYTTEIPDPGPNLLKVLYHIAAAAFRSGITLPRWQNITTCMIEKIPGTPRINKLRVIHLYEADYNAVNKLVWQRGVVWDAHQKGSLNKAQSGSRPARTCIEVVTSKDMKYLNSALTRSPMATMDNDAKSCYDRVIASLALLISHHYGVPESICKTVGDTLQRMKFRIRTAMGISEDFYSHTEHTPIHGVGQGGTASPAFWLLISSILFDCYEKRAQGMKLQDPTGVYSVQQWLEALVDDTSIFTNVAANKNVGELVKALESDAQYWANLLSVSGGCLELPKCFYYVLAWNFTQQGDTTPMTSEEINNCASKIKLCEFGKDELTSIKMQSVDEAHKTLGVMKTMVGNDASHIRHLSTRSNNISSIVATSGMFPYQTDVALRMIYTSAMLYSLPSVNIGEKDLNKIQYKALEQFVPALGYNRGFPRAVLLGPTDYGGAAIPHLYTECNIQKLEMIIMHVRANTELGILFRINLNWIQLISGLTTPFFEHSIPQPFLHNWFTGLRDFLISINGTLCISDTYVPQLERIHDQSLMEVFSTMSPKLSKNQIRYVLNWRLFFQVQTLSDICNAKGDIILDIYLKYPSSDNIKTLRPDRISRVEWPYQPHPTSKSTFSLWVRCLRQCFLHQSGNKLRQPLANWTVSPYRSLSRWQSYYDPTSKSLYHLHQDSYIQYKSILQYTGSTVTYDIAQTDPIAHIPDSCVPIEICSTTTSIIAIHSKIKNDCDISIPTMSSNIDEAINQAPSWQFHLLRNYRIHDIDQLISCLETQDNAIISVSDGGCRDGNGSFGVSVGTMTEELYSIEGPAPGHDEMMTSFRSEGYGMLAGINFLCLFIRTHMISIPINRVITMYCDNLALVNWINHLMTCTIIPRMYIKPEADIVMQILHDLQELADRGLCIKILHVKGHQDKKTPYSDLTRPAQLNVDADTYATNYLNNGTVIKYQLFPANPVTLYLSKCVITSKYKREIRKSSRSPELRIYLIDKFNWAQNTPDLIWWEIHGSSIFSLPFNDRRRIRKFIFRWLPTCERLKMQEDEVSEACPVCGYVETHAHLLKCPCKSRAKIKSDWFVTLKTFLYNAAFTPAIMGEILYKKVFASCSTDTPLPLPTIPPYLQKAYEEQALIGWDQLISGRLAYKWGNIIANHLYQTKCDEKVMTALTWGRKFVRLMYELVLKIWNQRNTDCHLSTNRHDSKLTRERLMANIEAMQASNPDIQHYDRVFVFRSMETLESYSLSNLQAWHRMAKNIIVASIKRTGGRKPRGRNSKSAREAHDEDNPTLEQSR